MLIKFLLWVGFVKVGRTSTQIVLIDTLKPHDGYRYVYPEQIIWPFRVPPLWQLKHPIRHLRYYWHIGMVYRFKNLPGVIKWRKGRLLPVRWGFGICGFEFGDRG